MLRHLDLFSGIGGFALAAQMVGNIETRQFVEIDPYAQKVLAKNFPGVPIHDDITTFTTRSGEFDLVTGGFPCQDISSANPNGRGLEGGRSGLFYELMRVVRKCRPDYIVLENVAAMLSKHHGRVMGAILWELSESGYDAEWQTISAASVGAPHLRQRVFIVAYSKEKFSHKANHLPAKRWAQQQLRGSVGRSLTSLRWNPNQPALARVVHGVSRMLDRTTERVSALGNAIVPQCGAIALQRILDIHNQQCAE